MTTYEDLCEATLPHGLMPLVVPELKTITLGGAVTGLGIEATSVWHGLPHESVTEMQLLTGDGRVVIATKDNEHSDLFYGFPNSYGTLGYTLALTIELMPVKPYVHMRHFAFNDPKSCMDAIAEIARDGSYHGHKADFLDGVAFSTDELYLTVGAFSDKAPWTSDYTGQQIYYQSLQAQPRGLPHGQGLHLALGHRLVLVRRRVRPEEQDGPPAVAAQVPALGRLPQARRASTRSTA